MSENYLNYQKHYSEKGLISKLGSTAKKAGLKVVYAALLLYYVLDDPNVTMADKAKIYGALGYFILPVDLIPDFVPMAGYGDDFTALMWALHSVWKNVTPEMKQRARRKLSTWFGCLPDEELIIF